MQRINFIDFYLQNIGIFNIIDIRLRLELDIYLYNKLELNTSYIINIVNYF